MSSKIGYIGHFNRENAFDGQTIKTIEILECLYDEFGRKNIVEFSYHAAKNSKVKLLSGILGVFSKCKKVIIIANATSVKSLLKVCTKINRLYKRELHFILVGGALPQTLEADPGCGKILKQFSGIYVETDILKRDTEKFGLDNVYILVNFKKIKKYTKEEIPTEFEKPYKLIFMSRITEIKGVCETYEALRRINAEKVKYTLDLYGMIDDAFAQKFDELQKDSPEYIKYHGVCSPSKVSEIMHGYFLHILPTTCATEGQPASVIDGYFAGLPILCGRWNSCGEMVPEGKTGVSFELGNFDDFCDKLNRFYEHPELLTSMRENCIDEAEKFSPEGAMKELILQLKK